MRRRQKEKGEGRICAQFCCRYLDLLRARDEDRVEMGSQKGFEERGRRDTM